MITTHPIPPINNDGNSREWKATPTTRCIVSQMFLPDKHVLPFFRMQRSKHSVSMTCIIKKVCKCSEREKKKNPSNSRTFFLQPLNRLLIPQDTLLPGTLFYFLLQFFFFFGFKKKEKSKIEQNENLNNNETGKLLLHNRKQKLLQEKKKIFLLSVASSINNIKDGNANAG